MAPELAVSPALGGIAVAVVIVAVAGGVASYRERHRPVPPDPLEVSEAALVTAVLVSPDARDFAELGADEVRILVGWMLESLRARRAPLDGRRGAGAGAGRKAASRRGLRVGRAELVEELLTRSRNAGSPLEPPAVHALVTTTARLLEQGLDTPPPPRLGPRAAPLDQLGPVAAPLDQLGPVAAPLDQLGPLTAPLDQLGPLTAPLDQLGPLTAPLDQLGPRAAPLDQLGFPEGPRPLLAPSEAPAQGADPSEASPAPDQRPPEAPVG